VAPGPTLAAFPPDELMTRYGSLPLLHQPGEKWLYNSGSDILGVLIQRVTGRTLGAFLQERIFTPLGMKDTGFHVPADKLDRLPPFYAGDPASGGLKVFDEARGGQFSRPPALESGAGGLVATVDDFLVFGRMMLGKGTLGGQRILSPESVAQMTTDHITAEQKAASPFFPGFWDIFGWGLGVAIVTRPDEVTSVPGRYGWDGGYGTSWFVDPKQDLVGILMCQRLWDPTFLALRRDFWLGAYQAINS
jgi:CubicO group peptidase (beta-lactamase class C family)